MERVEGWEAPNATLDDGADWDDLVAVPHVEADLFSTRFRDAVEAVRRKGDTHAWLPVGVVQGDERRQYWLLNAWGAGAKDTWGLHGDLAAGRTVVLPCAGDWLPVFAQRARAAVDRAGVAVEWRIER